MKPPMKLEGAFALALCVAAGCALSSVDSNDASDLAAILARAKSRVFPSLVFVSPVVEQFREGERKRQEVVVPGGDAKKAALVDTKLLEVSRHGPIPKVAADGLRPLDAYARKMPATTNADGPRVALIVGGLGVGASSTSDALSKITGPVTFAFTPYGSDLDNAVSRARGNGHEVLLQVPMEPFDYPDNDPGPQTRWHTKGGTMDQPKVFVYALSTCGHCRNTKRLLDENNVEYDSVDVDLLPKDELKTVLEEVRKVNPQAAFPTILIGDKVIVGYRELEILEALGL